MQAATQTTQPDLFTPRSIYPDDVPPAVCVLFEQFALDVAARGYRRYSADSICHRIRWEEHVVRGNDAFKVNDHWVAPLARWWLARHPEHPKFFETRTSKHDS